MGTILGTIEGIIIVTLIDTVRGITGTFRNAVIGTIIFICTVALIVTGIAYNQRYKHRYTRQYSDKYR